MIFDILQVLLYKQVVSELSASASPEHPIDCKWIRLKGDKSPQYVINIVIKLKYRVHPRME